MKNGKFKRILSLALSAVIALGVFVPGTEIFASAAIVDSGTCGENLTWTLDDKGLLTISGEGDMDDYDYSSNSYIRTPWCSFAVSIKTIVIENGVTSIGNYAFNGFQELTSITIPDSVNYIGDKAFVSCYSLASITIPDSVTSIGEGAFDGCRFRNILVDGNNRFYSIDENGALYNKEKTQLIKCPTWHSNGKKRTEFVIPDTVSRISGYAFSNCSFITTLSIPDSVTSIGEGAFANCESLTSITIPDGITTIESSTFEYCYKLTSITIPDSVTSIGDLAFFCCGGLTNVAIPENVKYIGERAFQACENLKLFIPGYIESIGNAAFEDVPMVVSPYLDNYGYILGAKSTNNNIKDCFAYTDSTMTAIALCLSTTSGKVFIPDNVSAIDDGAFEYCSGISTIYIPDSVKSIGASAFKNCSGLSSIRIPAGVSKIGPNAFDFCSGLSNIVVDGGNRYYSNDANGVLFNKDKTTLISYPAKSSNSSYSVPDGVTEICENAFFGCSQLENVIIPDSVKTIGDNAFFNVNNITYNENLIYSKLQWGAKAANSFNDGTFVYSDSSKTTIVCCFVDTFGEVAIPDSVTRIEDYAFYYCYNIKKVIIPDSVQYIGAYAFQYCGSLLSLNIPDGVQQIGAYAFQYCDNLLNLNIPNSVWSIGENAFINILSITYDPEKMLASGSPWGAKSTKAYFEGDFVYYDNSKAMLIGCLDSDSENITVPDCVEAVDGYAFTLCDNLKILKFASPQIVFSPETLVGCSSVQAVRSSNTSDGITYTNYNPDVSSANGGEVQYTDDNGILFADRTMSGTYSVPDSISFICPSAFATCSELEITIPDSVTLTSIGKDAFYSSKNYIDWSKSGTFQIGNYLIEAAKTIASFAIPANIICIADGAFDGCFELSSVSSLGRCLLSVGKGCFRGCSKLKTVSIPDTVRYVGSSAFEDTPITEYAVSDVITVGTTLVSVPLSTRRYDVPDNITCIADGAFRGCELMTSVTVPDSITAIGEDCFAGCLALKEISIPGNTVSIGKNAFKDCVSLAKINIPENVEKIDYTAFYGCSGIDEFSVSESNDCFSSENGILMNKDKTELLQYPASKEDGEYTIPLNVSFIESLAFRKCLNLSRISIPKGIKYGFKNPFENCNLENRLYSEEGFDDYNNTVYYISDGKWELVSVTQKIDGTYVIEKEVSTIRDGAFKDQTGITEIIFNDKLSVIGEEAFMGCTGLTEISIPAGVTRIEKSAFEDCVNLEKVTFGTYNGYENEALESVGEYAFANTGMNGTENVFGPDGTRYNRLFVETDAFHQHTPGKPETVTVSDSTCSEEGLCRVITHCTDEKCGKVISNVAQTIPKKEHKPKEPVIENATTSSCLVEGKYDLAVYCAECGNEISRETVIVKPEGHQYIDNVTEPTCDKQGFTTHTCICGDSYVDSYTDALGHSFSHYVFNNDAEVGKDGTETAKCERCDETDTRIAVGTAKKEAVIAIKNMAKYNGKSIDYKSTITFFADIRNCTDVVWYVNGQRANANDDGSCTVTEAKENIEIYCTAEDEGGNTVRSETEKITVKRGFFDKLIAFFRGLFKSLPVITQ